MSQSRFRIILSTILVVLPFLVVLVTFDKEMYSLQVARDYPYYQWKPTNVPIDGTKYFANQTRPSTQKMLSFTRGIVGEEHVKGMSGLQTELSDEFFPPLSDSRHLIRSLNSSLQNSPLDLLNNSSISASVTVYLNNSATVPDDLRRLRPKILNDFPSTFLPSYKNPCYIRYSEKQLHCLPYFFLLGTPKSGTTDIWSKIVAHPEIVAYRKEPHWWTRKSYPSAPLTVYEQQYMTKPISRMTEQDSKNKRIIVTGDGSASTLWDNLKWTSIYPEYNNTGPPYIIADVIHTVLPDAKLLVSFRDPTDRLYSDYVYFNYHTSPEKFHERVVKEINKFTTCLTERPLEACAYDGNGQKVRLRIGLYSVYLRDWLERYPRKQIMVLKLEEWHSRCTQILPEIYEFLNVASLSPTSITEICTNSTKNVTKRKKQIGPMLNSTRKVLREFYRPYVVKLASILNDDRFLWDYDGNDMLQNS